MVGRGIHILWLLSGIGRYIEINATILWLNGIFICGGERGEREVADEEKTKGD